jgi:signal peptidase I
MVAGFAAAVLATASSAYRFARRAPEDFRLRRYNRWYVYVALVLVAAYVVEPGYALLQRRYIAEAFRMPSVSMEPTVLAGDFVFARRFGRASGLLRRRALIVYESMTDPGVSVIKRIVGLPGDTLQMERHALLVNGGQQLEPFTQRVDSLSDLSDTTMLWQRRFLLGPVDSASYHPSRDNWGPIIVPPNAFFVLGDNRDNSYDSRYWGFVSRQHVIGWPARIYFSYDPGSFGPLPFVTAIRWSRIGQPLQ